MRNLVHAFMRYNVMMMIATKRACIPACLKRHYLLIPLVYTNHTQKRKLDSSSARASCRLETCGSGPLAFTNRRPCVWCPDWCQ